MSGGGGKEEEEDEEEEAGGGDEVASPSVDTATAEDSTRGALEPASGSSRSDLFNIM